LRNQQYRRKILVIRRLVERRKPGLHANAFLRSHKVPAPGHSQTGAHSKLAWRPHIEYDEQVKKFPLAPLVELRSHAVEGCRETLTEKDLHLRKAQQAQALAEQSLRAHDAERRAVEEREAARLAAGEVTAFDLCRLMEYEAAARAQAFRLQQQNHVQEQKLQRAERERAEAEQALADARAEQRLIERQHERFAQQQLAQVQARHDEEALEVWQARKVQG
jgi:hypothetical protein